uniref:Uncharacterized protein n=1 Tax=Arundo donax TaxID=35708 RepID=A0A0A9M4U2_ARUDO
MKNLQGQHVWISETVAASSHKHAGKVDISKERSNH